MQEKHLTNFYRFQQKEKRRSGEHGLTGLLLLVALLPLCLANLCFSASQKGPESTALSICEYHRWLMTRRFVRCCRADGPEGEVCRGQAPHCGDEGRQEVQARLAQPCGYDDWHVVISHAQSMQDDREAALYRS